MRPVTPEFLAAVGGSHQVATEVKVYAPHSTEGIDVPVTEGTVTLDDTAAIRGRCDLTVAGLDWIPTDTSDRLAPFGAEVRVRRGVKLLDGSWEWVGLGWFGLEDAEITDDGTGAGTRVQALDRAERITKAKIENTLQVPLGVPLSQAILLLVLDAWPDCPYDPALPDASTITLTDKPLTAQAGDDRWELVQGIATALGMVLYFDGDGVLTLRRYLQSAPVVNITEGENGTLLSASLSLSRTDAHNRWIATGESAETDEVYRGEATDLNPYSPTYYYGPFGKCPDFYTHPGIQSNEQAQDAADALMAQRLGAPSNLNFGMVPNPALEPGDTVRITRQALGVDEDHIIDTLTFGLSTEAVTGQTRERLVAA